MKSLYSMFLSQAYQDCWDDYNRSVKLKNFPRWDYVILTASNDQQAEGFRRQIEERKEYLPRQGQGLQRSRIGVASVWVPAVRRWRC